ncbi:FAD synthetase 2, chloroplastic-like [Mercurialis annua]|uniref:FAD synthetase 2, chloroplastic-like n=1 Tax=Mercurialis annua TaxID=3986 RepID=UPI00215E0C72|nr:FAD synthetase 2, chloroplastic-like [Mercurialis annua]
MLGGGSRISLHLRECSHLHLLHHYQHHHHHSFNLAPSTTAISSPHNRHQLQRMVSYTSIQSKSAGEIPIMSSDCFSQHEDDDHQLPPQEFSPVAGGIVALGKFDALHIGHRELAIQASKVGTPYILSFVGMAEVLGWESRPPVVAKCDRHRVLASWAQYCGNVTPSEFQVEFSSVRHLSPQQFVEKLSKELKVCGVVAGENYRFGYKAAGDASDLVTLCEEYGLEAYIINAVMDKKQDLRNMDLTDIKNKGQVSSTRIRQVLAVGDMKYVSELLGRRHRLMLKLKGHKVVTTSSNQQRFSAPRSCFLNLPPKTGFYKNCSLFLGNENPLTCSVVIDSTYIHLEMDGLDISSYIGSPDFQLVGVEFGD